MSSRKRGGRKPPRNRGREKRRPPVEAPALSKIPVLTKATDFHQFRPAWRVRDMELVDAFGWHELDRDRAVEIRTKLANFETMTWGEVLLDSQKQNHLVSVADIANEAQRRLEVLQLEDLDKLVSLRLGGKPRVWGFLDGAVLHLLWWDPEHRVCPSLKKYT